MKVRKPSFDFSGTPAHWAPLAPELAQGMNASSLWIPPLERFLNRVMSKALAEIKGDDPDTQRLRGEMRTFVRQESCHYAIHEAFNAVLPANGYDVSEFTAIFEANFARLLETKSLGFLTAYCEGFETLGPPSALIWLDEIDDLLVGADPEAVKLWKWHLMEEYEHRTVCHDVYHRIHGGYFMRIYGLFYHYAQLLKFSGMVRKKLFAQDEARMTPEELKVSRRRGKKIAKRIAWLTFKRLVKTLSPFYTPRKAAEPKQFTSYMARIEAELA